MSTEEGLPVALILSRHDYAPTDAAWQLGDAAPLAFLGVDSGQMALIAGHVLPGWSHIDPVDFHSPASDYDWAAVATLRSQLGADFLGNRLMVTGDPYPATQIGTAVASRTRYGDGQYPLYVARNASGVSAVAVLFNWDQISDSDDWDDGIFEEFPIERADDARTEAYLRRQFGNN
ncbi:MAG: hypothetical protein IPK17_38370 [Chloroflexi bacterium]|uniref:hypothetical protein n=1 Tax=Candidatus Flexifilum breve TaxID=3140694 RepID=UPI003135308A|nr:hypothetical protein [Chloroflexota bacterium]